MTDPAEQDPFLNRHNLQPHTRELVMQFNAELDQHFDDENRLRIDSALHLMLEVHADQADRVDGTPYVEHPLSVGATVLALQEEKDADIIIAALLHDSVEDQAAKLAKKAGQYGSALADQDVALSYISSRFGQRVAKIVTALTNPD